MNAAQAAQQEPGAGARSTRSGALRMGGAAAAVAAVALGGGTAGAQAPRPAAAAPRQSVTLDAARALVDAALARAQAIGVPMSVVVVDESGVLKAFARMDGNSQASVQLVQSKAFTANAFRAPTHVLAANNAADPTRVASIAAEPNMTLLAGGYPIAAGGVVVGGLGVGGGSPQQDMEVAEAALTVLQ